MAHTHITGQNFNTFLHERIIAAVRKGHGVFLLDPHGHHTDTILPYITKKRVQDTILFDPSREEVVQFNPLEDSGNIPLTAALLLDSIKDAWGYGGVATPVMDMYLFFSLFALSETGQTLVELPTLLTDKSYRQKLVAKLKDATVKDFWLVFDTMSPKEQRDQVSSTLNKALMLNADPRIRRTLGRPASAFALSDVVKDKILLARLPQGLLSKGRTKMLGSVLLSLINHACLNRDQSVPFEVFLPDCYLWPGAVLEDMLTGVGAKNVRLTLTHQNIDQLDPTTYAAAIGNCEQQFVFRTSLADAQRLYDRLDRDQKMMTRFDQLEDDRYRYAPFYSRHWGMVAPLPSPTYNRAVSDIELTHRLRYWGAI